ncbi:MULTISPECIES: dihydrolipoyl dehydrogenase [Bacillales]|uniref:Dihydrolipoyl dehydrogenase n=1 Tax=Lysinibacillus louembei TaxID=1470088 RepID=A0ABZ0RV87_9BACI|nr:MULTISPECIES: dihydrolipoyl dehydrogenase [Bacillales]MCT6922976.1 dihydrolipoyl dehydrogenase [Metasolibacillus sp.]MCT6939214.1 dihydrolipoyl dehydrogenase [Metasolibacillus sp.]WPK10941.1 dihydrolipoyl dehydrogenase [Lysinibacillus louembei]
MAHEYDVVILGGGTGGYVAAIRAAQLGLKTAVVEKAKLGGTCLHKGCIPSKALLRSAEVYRTAKESETFGVEVAGVKLQFEQVQNRKNSIIKTLHAGIEGLMKKGKIDVYYGTGRILGPSIFSPMPGTISVELADGGENEMLVPTNVIIATGSKPATLEGIPVDGERILNSDHALELESLPASILIVGGGVIGIEWASMLCDFGVDVTVLEYGDRILPTEDADISKEMTKALTKRGVRIVTNARMQTETLKADEEVSITVTAGDTTETYSAEKMLVSVGRTANTEGIGLENTEIVTERSYIQVNANYQTKESHIYAIGDAIGGMQLAHVASHEGIVAVEHIAGHKTEAIHYPNVARCIYSYPEASSVGLTEAQAKEQGFDVKVAKFPFKAIGKALVHGDAEGFVKMIADSKTNDLLGVHMIGPHVTDMISESALALLLDASPWEIAQTIHPHPSLSEIIGEAALAIEGRAIHF